MTGVGGVAKFEEIVVVGCAWYMEGKIFKWRVVVHDVELILGS